MSKAHEVFLQELMRVPGVKSAMFVNNRGEALLSFGQFTINAQSTTQVSTIATQLIAITEMAYGKSDEASMLFGEGRVTAITNLNVMIESTYGAQEVFLLVFSAPTVNLPTMRMTIKVAASRLKMDKEVSSLRASVGVDKRNVLSQERLDATSKELFEAMQQARV